MTMLARITPGPSGFDIHTFECPACNRVHQRLVERVDPMKSPKAAGWLRGELRAPNNEFDPQDFLAKVGAGKTILKFEKSQHVFEQGDVADTVFYIQKGSVKLTVLSEQGKEAVVGILETGQFFGEGCLNGHRLRIATTMAAEISAGPMVWRSRLQQIGRPRAKTVR